MNTKEEWEQGYDWGYAQAIQEVKEALQELNLKELEILLKDQDSPGSGKKK